MRILGSKKLMALVGSVLVAVVLAAVGLAAVLSQTVLADGTNIRLRVVRTVANDFDSGWHTHPGLVVVQVQQGALQITQGTCTPKTVGPGETYTEVPYLPARAVATGFVAWTTTLIVKYEDALQVPATSPCP